MRKKITPKYIRVQGQLYKRAESETVYLDRPSVEGTDVGYTFEDLELLADILSDITGLDVRATKYSGKGDLSLISEDDFFKALDIYYEEVSSEGKSRYQNW